MTTSKTTLFCVGACAVFFLVLCGLLAAPAVAQKREYKEAHVYVTAPSVTDTSASAGQLGADRGFQAFAPLDQPDEHDPTIIIDESKTFQTIEGFGGAFTDAAATTFGKLPKEAQEAFLKACFDPVEGNGYTLCRTTIHSCDYSADMYTYDETPGDKELKDFSIKHDLTDRIPFIKRAMAVAGKDKLRLYASPWSPPGWMKTNGEMLHGGKLRPEYFQTWADYYVKYIQAYAKEGIPMWGLTVQNEALAVQVWESCIFTAEEERDFVKKFLGPALQKAGLKDVKLMIWDHNRGLIYQRAQVAYEDPEASKFIWGAAFHWYTGDHFDNVRMVHDAFPDKHLLYTEGGIGGNWQAAQRLAKSMILDLNNWTEGWTLWNLMCDEKNGPRHAGDIPGRIGTTSVNADTKTGKVTYNPPHYVMGQFSRFIKPGAKRIACTSNSDDLIATAAINPDGKVAVVVQNLTNHEVFFHVWVRGQSVRYTSPPNATITFVLQPV
jgi:glucosylceramidase